MKKIGFSLLLCFSLLVPHGLRAAEESTSSEWKWKVALGAALTALSVWFLGYFGQKSSPKKI